MATRLGEFLEGYIQKRTDVKPRTRINLNATKVRLVEFFGKDKNMAEITPADADAFLLFLRQRYANATAGRAIKRAKQFFRAATRGKLLAENAFADVKPPSEVNESRKHFVVSDVAQRVLSAQADVPVWRAPTL